MAQLHIPHWNKAAPNQFKEFLENNANGKTTDNTALNKSLREPIGAPVRAPDLTNEVARTFDNKIYVPRVLSADLIVYRSEGTAFGRWYGLEKPSSAAHAEKLYNVVDYGNDVLEISTYRVPKNTVVYYGKVAGGSGYQIYIPDPRKSGITQIHKEGLPQSGF